MLSVKLIFVFFTYFLVSVSLMHKILTLSLLLMLFMYYVSFFLNTTWVSLIFCLMMLSGMLVLFVYMISLKKETKVLFSIKMFFFTLFMLLTFSHQVNFMLNFKNISNTFSLSLNLYNSMWSGMIMVLLFFYLLTLLVLSMELIFSVKSSFRSL